MSISSLGQKYVIPFIPIASKMGFLHIHDKTETQENDSKGKERHDRKLKEEKVVIKAIIVRGR